MRPSITLPLYSIILLYFSISVSAWPWPRWLPELDALVVRQESGNSTAAVETGTASNTASPTGSASASITGTLSSAPTTTGSSGSASKTASPTTSSSISVDPRLPAGGVAMITPAVALGEQFYKIGDFITFGWNYTSLQVTPTAVNIMATCIANQQLYTIQMNQTVANSTGAVTWDTGAYQATAVSNPLFTEMYTLIIYDAASAITANAQAGYLAVYNQYKFGMYMPQPYVSLADGWKCATCSSGAFGDMERRALGMMLGMCCLTVASFTWFVSGTGIIW